MCMLLLSCESLVALFRFLIVFFVVVSIDLCICNYFGDFDFGLAISILCSIDFPFCLWVSRCRCLMVLCNIVTTPHPAHIPAPPFWLTNIWYLNCVELPSKCAWLMSCMNLLIFDRCIFGFGYLTLFVFISMILLLLSDGCAHAFAINMNLMMNLLFVCLMHVRTILIDLSN